MSDDNGNINAAVKAKQRKIALYVAGALLVSAGAGYGLYTFSQEPEETIEAAEKAPPLTGSVDANLQKKVQKTVIEKTEADNRRVLQMMREINAKLDKSEQDKRELLERVDQLEKDKADLQSNARSAGGSAASDEPPLSNTIDAPRDTQNGEQRPGEGYFPPSYPQGGKISIEDNRSMVLQRKTWDYPVSEAEKPPRYKFPYIPSGSFAKAVVIEGADTNAGTQGNKDTMPMMLRLTGVTNMPNDKTFDLQGCFVTLEAYGDVSSERAEVRSKKISCLIDGETIDQKFEGHVSFKGKNGIKGEVVMRNGDILGWAWGAGFLNGIGNGLTGISTPTVGAGASAQRALEDVLKGGVGGGTSNAAQTLSDYYIDRAEQYHEIIPIGAGNEVEIVFNEGFQLYTIDEDPDREDNDGKTYGERARNAVKDGIYSTHEEARNAADIAKHQVEEALNKASFKESAKQLPTN